MIRVLNEAGVMSACVECYPPDATVYLSLHIPAAYREFRSQGDVAKYRSWLARGDSVLRTLIGPDVFQDFRADLSRVLGEIETELAKESNRG